MDDFLDLPTLIAIVVAVFVLFRLRSVLGTRTGNERPPVDRSRSTPTEKKAANGDDTVVPIRPQPTDGPNLDDERRARRRRAMPISPPAFVQLSRPTRPLHPNPSLKAPSRPMR